MGVISQRAAFERRDEIRPGDRFCWSFHGGFGTSGKLPANYMRVSTGWGEGEQTLTVCKMYVGHNRLGGFVDYFLSPSGSPTDETILVINGSDAFRMQRAG